MLTLPRSKNTRFKISFLCVLFICIFIACAAYGQSEIENFSCGNPGGASAVLSLEKGFPDIAADENTGSDILKDINSGNARTGRTAGSGSSPAFAAVHAFFVFAVISILYCLRFFETAIPGSLFIITYIHNLDGMKP